MSVLVTKLKAFTKWVNWSMVSTILSIILAVIVGVQYFTGLKYDGKDNARSIEALTKYKANASEVVNLKAGITGDFNTVNAKLEGISKALDNVTEQLGELRKAHIVVASTVQSQGQSIKTNSKSIEDTKIVIKTLPEVVTNKVLEHPQVLAVTDVKKKISH